MNRNLILTEDGSHSLRVPQLNVTYHSMHGAIQESQHIYIEAGLKPLMQTHTRLSIFEMGFGTGLNALLTLLQASNAVAIHYETAEAFPLNAGEAGSLNYIERLRDRAAGHYDAATLRSAFLSMHQSPPGIPVAITRSFSFFKHHGDIREIHFQKKFHLVYYDAFDPVAQPELWDVTQFRRMRDAMHPQGALLTYCSKGSVRRAMKDAGFSVEKLSGPKGKREIVRATAV